MLALNRSSTDSGSTGKLDNSVAVNILRRGVEPCTEYDTWVILGSCLKGWRCLSGHVLDSWTDVWTGEFFGGQYWTIETVNRLTCVAKVSWNVFDADLNAVLSGSYTARVTRYGRENALFSRAKAQGTPDWVVFGDKRCWLPKEYGAVGCSG